MVTLAEELPFAACVQDEELDEVCSSCFKCKETQTNLHLSRCIGCRVLHYCSNECQKKDWVNHKHECPLLKNLHSRVPNVMIRLIARIVFKLKRSDAQNASFNGRRFEDLMDHCEDMLQNPGKMNFFRDVSANVKRFMGREHAPKQSELMSILGKININGFAIYDFMGASTDCFEARMNFKKLIGKAIYVGLSIHDHSCFPDAFLVSDGPKLILRTPDLDREYSKDITVSYIDLIRSPSDRISHLESKYCFTCTCLVCEDSTNEPFQDSMVSTCCPDSYCLFYGMGSRLSCFNCGAPSNITPGKAASALGEALFFSEMIKVDASMMPLSLLLRNSIEQYEEFSEILSPFNMTLLLISDSIFRIAVQIRDAPVIEMFAEINIRAFKAYIRFGDPSLTTRLWHIASVVSAARKRTKLGLELIQQAVDAFTASHGPDHPHYPTINRMLLTYRKKLVDPSA